MLANNETLYYFWSIKINVMYEKTNTIIDSETGEIKSQTIEIFKKIPANNFIQVYLQDMSGLMGIKTMAEYNVMVWFWKFSKFPTEELPANYVSLDSILLETIEKETGLKTQSIRNTISSLVKKEILLKDEKHRGIYYLNKNFFFKGKLTDKTKTLTTSINYDLTK